MRPLPPSCVDWQAPAGRARFAEALAAGEMESYFALAAQFATQGEPAFCGPATLAQVLNALNIDPGRVWKGPWRWYDESMLDACVPREEVLARGIGLDAFACLARCSACLRGLRRAVPRRLTCTRCWRPRATPWPSLRARW